ncbi:hypothetical protein BVV10_02715 [Xanthomonas oryzae pv. oryzae]|nr:hypothetical protein BVV16_02710 [Xanthomonas oryzae pv. oryzae]OWB33981.1 hypothetical protein XocBAI21_00030 [Xanthomonas oryzae pv. oryzicola]AUI95979.1 hypothetical protein BVV17_02710 [Xanthomonas oryzae pv. oryzae]AUI99652.1 hypothetical protein BVV18_02715 [Xanthomonas oryzae pv. oryzae]AUJ03332.1 hypothetical protein BVV10_02715 [Xanthomonas oryzae pv. oryzae]
MKAISEMHMDDAMVCLSGEYVLTAHVVRLGAECYAEILVSRSGGITLRQHRLPVTGFTSYSEASSYALSQMRTCRVSGNGTLLMPVVAENQRLQ